MELRRGEKKKKKDKSLNNHSLIRLMLLFYLGLQRRKKTTSDADKPASAAGKCPRKTEFQRAFVCQK